MPAKVIGKKELVNIIAQKGSLTKKDSEKMLNAFLETVTESLSQGHSIRLISFGSFEVKERQGRKGRNPKTGEEIMIESRKVPVFKAGKGLKDVIN